MPREADGGKHVRGVGSSARGIGLRGADVRSGGGSDDRPPVVLIADDDPVARESLSEFVAGEGYPTLTVVDGRRAVEAVASRTVGAGGGAGAGRIGVVLCDVTMPGLDGMGVLDELSRRHPDVAVVMMTGYGTIESAVRAVRRGAVDYLTKPIVDEELRLALERAVRQHTLMNENRRLRQRLAETEGGGLGDVVGTDSRMRRIFDLVEAVAPTRTTVLMTGESGVGKSLIARAIHDLSPRGSRGSADGVGGPYVELACGSIPETLLESELFGHTKGAFTGAHTDKPGKFLAADGGTLFLDEINSASPGMQLKLLRVLQERKFEPVGSNETIEVDVRVILASNQPLEKLVREGTFRQDLYYRINVVQIEVPPLRDRVGDVVLLATHFLEQCAEELGKELIGFSSDAIDVLRRYAFPGNVRELSNIVERAAVLSRSPTIGVEDLPPQVRGVADGAGGGVGGVGGVWGGFGSGSVGGAGEGGGGDGGVFVATTLTEAMVGPERSYILASLEHHGWNRQRTAEQLGINRTTLYKKMRQLGIEAGEQF